MLALVTFVIWAQAQAPLREADIGPILAAAMESLERTIPAEKLASRPLFVAVEETTKSFQELIPDARAEPLANFDRQYVAREFNQAVTCEPGGTPRRGCRVNNYGILVTIRRASRTANPGEYRIALSVAWSDPEPLSPGEPAIESFTADLYIASVQGLWRVVRKGPMIISLNGMDGTVTSAVSQTIPTTRREAPCAAVSITFEATTAAA
jgi:hypothetical protein